MSAASFPFNNYRRIYGGAQPKDAITFSLSHPELKQPYQRPSQQYRVGHVPRVILAAYKGFQLASDHAAIVSCDPSVLRKAYLVLKRDDVVHRHDAFAYQYAAGVLAMTILSLPNDLACS